MSAETLAAKAVKMAGEICWGIVPGRRDLLRCVSPTSGNTYQLTLGADGDVTCNCRAGQSGRACYHIAALAVDYPSAQDGIRELTRSAVAPETVRPVRAPRPGDKAFAADWS